MTALYFDVLRPQDRVAVKPHASPVFHAIQYLLGRQTREKLERFRALGGAQSYPSRTKDSDDVDFSTGSVGLGVAHHALRLPGAGLRPPQAACCRRRAPAGRMIALVGDAELDEGNVFEALLEGWKHDVRNLWWIIDYNRQSLDGVVSDRLFHRIDGILPHGGLGRRDAEIRQAARGGVRAGRAARRCATGSTTAPTQLYSALVFQGGAGWRAAPQARPRRRRRASPHCSTRMTTPACTA